MSKELEDMIDSDNSDEFMEWLNDEIGFDDPEPEDNKEDDELIATIEDDIFKPDTSDMSEIEKEMARTIYNTDKTSWEKGEGYHTGFDMLDEKLNGLQPGLAIVGADSNTGKSTFLLNLAHSTAMNDDVYSLYFSLDDEATNLLPRVVAMNKNIPINAIRIPHRYTDYPSVLERRKEGIKDLYSMTDRFKVISDKEAYTIEYMSKEIKRHKEYAESIGKKLFVLIDSFHDVDIASEDYYDDNEKYSEVATELKEISKDYNVPVWCTSELRKLNAYRRPSCDDIRHASKIKFKANLILLLHNDVGQKGNNAGVYYRNKDTMGKSPVLEVDFGKNKLSAYKGRVYFEMIPEYAKIIECNEEDKQRYDSLVHQEDN